MNNSMDVVATTVLPADDAIVELGRREGWIVERGSERDLLDRYLQAARANAAERVIRITSDCPLIDPDLIGPGDLRTPVTGDPAYDLWHARHQWVTALRTTMQGTPQTLAGLDDLLQKSLGTSVEDLKALDQESQRGISIAKRLEQLTLPINAYSRLVRIQDLVAQGTPVLSADWDDVYAILTQVSKCRAFAAWHAEEQGVVLSPDYFTL